MSTLIHKGKKTTTKKMGLEVDFLTFEFLFLARFEKVIFTDKEMTLSMI